MEELSLKALKEKVVDYTRFAHVLLSLGVFMFLGVVIPDPEKGAFEVNLAMIMSVIFLAGSFFFYYKSSRINQKMLDEREE